jgi:hypothetical protein
MTIKPHKEPPSAEEALAILKAAADISDWGYGRWAYEKWELFNYLYFDGALQPGGIVWGLTPHGHSLGYYEPWRNCITLHTSLVKPAGRDPWGMGNLTGERLAADVLLHEMMHQAIHQRGGDPSRNIHNSEIWSAEINRLIPLLKIETKLIAKPVRQQRVREPGQKTGNGKVKWIVEDGCMNRAQLSTFPHSLRPVTYYETSSEQLLKSGLSVK